MAGWSPDNLPIHCTAPPPRSIPRRAASSGVSTSTNASGVATALHSCSSTRRGRPRRAGRGAARTRPQEARAARSASGPYRAHTGCSRPSTDGTTVGVPGQSRRNTSSGASTWGRSTASTSTAAGAERARAPPHPRRSPRAGPPPGGSSRTAGNAVHARRRPRRRRSHTGRGARRPVPASVSPSTTSVALSTPRRRLRPPVSRSPARRRHAGVSRCRSARRAWPAPPCSRHLPARTCAGRAHPVVHHRAVAQLDAGGHDRRVAARRRRRRRRPARRGHSARAAARTPRAWRRRTRDGRDRRGAPRDSVQSTSKSSRSQASSYDDGDVVRARAAVLARWRRRPRSTAQRMTPTTTAVISRPLGRRRSICLGEREVLVGEAAVVVGGERDAHLAVADVEVGVVVGGFGELRHSLTNAIASGNDGARRSSRSRRPPRASRRGLRARS